MFLLFFCLDMNYLLIGITHLRSDAAADWIMDAVRDAGGFFGILAAAAAWYNAFAGIMTTNNSFIVLPMGHFPWSPCNRRHQSKSDEKIM